MKAESLLDERYVIDDDAFVELVIWRLPEASRGSGHRFKYHWRLSCAGSAFFVTTMKLARAITGTFETGNRNTVFINPERLLQDFWTDVDAWRRK